MTEQNSEKCLKISEKLWHLMMAELEKKLTNDINNPAFVEAALMLSADMVIKTIKGIKQAGSQVPTAILYKFIDTKILNYLKEDINAELPPQIREHAEKIAQQIKDAINEVNNEPANQTIH